MQKAKILKRISAAALAAVVSLAVILPVIANFDGGVADHWRLEVTHPVEMEITPTSYNNVSSNQNNGMHVPYVKSDGTEDVYAAVLTVIHNEQNVGNYAKRSVLESTIPIQGYWDYTLCFFRSSIMR